MNRPDSNGSNYEKHAPRVSQVIAAVAKVSCKHGLWLVARVKKGQSFMLCPFLLSACVRGFEPPAFWSVAKRSIQLS